MRTPSASHSVQVHQGILSHPSQKPKFSELSVLDRSDVIKQTTVLSLGHRIGKSSEVCVEVDMRSDHLGRCRDLASVLRLAWLTTSEVLVDWTW